MISCHFWQIMTRNGSSCAPLPRRARPVSIAAKRHDVDLILTRNLRDFKGSPVAVMDPRQFCETYRPDGYVYDLVEL